jgi:hypothetical protein
MTFYFVTGFDLDRGVLLAVILGVYKRPIGFMNHDQNLGHEVDRLYLH